VSDAPSAQPDPRPTPPAGDDRTPEALLRAEGAAAAVFVEVRALTDTSLVSISSADVEVVERALAALASRRRRRRRGARVLRLGLGGAAAAALVLWIGGAFTPGPDPARFGETTLGAPRVLVERADARGAFTWSGTLLPGETWTLRFTARESTRAGWTLLEVHDLTRSRWEPTVEQRALLSVPLRVDLLRSSPGSVPRLEGRGLFEPRESEAPITTRSPVPGL